MSRWVSCQEAAPVHRGFRRHSYHQADMVHRAFPELLLNELHRQKMGLKLPQGHPGVTQAVDLLLSQQAMRARLRLRMVS